VPWLRGNKGTLVVIVVLVVVAAVMVRNDRAKNDPFDLGSFSDDVLQRDRLVGLDARTGRELWRLDGDDGRTETLEVTSDGIIEQAFLYGGDEKDAGRGRIRLVGDDGKVRWSAPVGIVHHVGPIGVLALDTSQRLDDWRWQYFSGPTNDVRWTFPSSNGPPQFLPDLALFEEQAARSGSAMPTTGPSVAAVDVATGDVRWRVEGAVLPDEQPPGGDVAVVIRRDAMTEALQVVAVDARSGAVRWVADAPIDSATPTMRRVWIRDAPPRFVDVTTGAVTPAPEVSNSVYGAITLNDELDVVGTGEGLRAVDRSGAIRWTVDGRLARPVAVLPTGDLVASVDRAVIAVSPQGVVRWVSEGARIDDERAITPDAKVLVATTTSDDIRAIDLRTGATLWTTRGYGGGLPPRVVQHGNVVVVVRPK
jgi:outer membrane protein assembly factor BamB